MAEGLIDLTGFQRDLLYVAAGIERPSGQDIKDEIESAYDTDITHGRLYPNLDTLHERGFLEKGNHDRRTNYYTLTDTGADALSSHQYWQQEYIPDEIATLSPT